MSITENTITDKIKEALNDWSFNDPALLRGILRGEDEIFLGDIIKFLQEDVIFAGSTHVNIVNNLSVVYIRGNEFTDDSIRLFIVDNGNTSVTEIQKRVSGVWAATSFMTGPTSLFLGLDLSLSAQGNMLSIESVESSAKELSIGAEFSDSGSDPAKVSILSTRINRLVVRSDISEELVTQSDTDAFTGLTNAFRYKFYFKTGSVAATDTVTLTITKGLTPGGAVFFKKEMPVSDWSANTEVEIELEGGLNITPGNGFSSTLSSPSDFSLLGNFSTGGGRFFAFDIQPFVFETLISTPTGTDRFLSDNSASFLADNSGNMVLQGAQVVPGSVA